MKSPRTFKRGAGTEPAELTEVVPRGRSIEDMATVIVRLRPRDDTRTLVLKRAFTAHRKRALALGLTLDHVVGAVIGLLIGCVVTLAFVGLRTPAEAAMPAALAQVQRSVPPWASGVTPVFIATPSLPAAPPTSTPTPLPAVAPTAAASQP